MPKKEDSPCRARLVLITRTKRKALELEALDIGKRHFLSIERQLERIFLKTGQKLDSNNILLEITIMEGITMNIETYLEDLKIRDKRNKKS